MQITITRVRTIMKVFDKLNHSQMKIIPEIRRDFETILQGPCEREKSIIIPVPASKDDNEQDSKMERNIPSRHFIKARSMSIVEKAHNNDRV